MPLKLSPKVPFAFPFLCQMDMNKKEFQLFSLRITKISS